ncbi:MAG TPA: hypothetical protein VFO85_08020, partial [Vicinamibacteria bacterium]|nr:hypothetical protein [Vicinamibacteria bacterium]
VTTATDVFALGALLYQLLSGRHPLGPAARESPGELVRAILDVEPARLPAVALEDAAGEDARERAGKRGTTPTALSRALKGDLETIVAKALKKDPEERYASAVALADDLRRWLEHAPIRARPDTFADRAARFARRHRLPVALASVLLLALAAGLAGTMWQARAAARERDLALAQLERADRLHSFTVFLLGKAFPGGEPVRIRDILDRGERLAQSQVEQDPALAVEMLIGIGGLYVVREDVAAGERVLKRAYDLAQTVADPTTRAGATCVWARVVALKGDTPAALRLVDAGLALTSEEARFDEVVSQCLVDRGSIAMNAGSGDVVARASEEALRRLGRRPHAFPEARFSALHLNAVSHRMAGETAEADRTFAEALGQLRRLGRDESTDAAVLLHNWALNTALTNPKAAAEQNRRVITLFEGARREGQPDSVPVPALLNYAVNLNRLSDHLRARAMAERTREVAERQGNRQAGSGAGVELATACLRLGTVPCARESLGRAAADVAAAYPDGHRVRGDLLRAQALLASREGSDAEALRLLRAAHAIHAKLQSPHPTQIETCLELSHLELRLGRPQEAEAQARAALAIAEKFQGGAPHSGWVGRSQLALAAARQAQGDAAGARALLASAAEHMAPTLGPSHPALLEARQLAAR